MLERIGEQSRIESNYVIDHGKELTERVTVQVTQRVTENVRDIVRPKVP